MNEAGSDASDTALPPSDYEATVPFDELALSPELRQAIAERGYRVPTAVQARAIPRVLAGKDLIVRSKTGTGKTAAFGIPLLERLPAGARRPLALILCPTRELAIQVAEELASLAKHKDLQVVAIYGGAPMQAQIDALEAGAEIIVGTPGRVYDHIRRKTLDLSRAQAAVLDEADEMLNQGFYEEVTRILERLPDGRQMLLFSATVTEDIERLIQRFTHEPETILLSGDVFTVEGIENVLYYTVDSYPKPRNLIYLLDIEQPEAAIIFCNTRGDTSLITAVLNRNGFDAEVLNGDLPQKERERVMAKVKRGELAYLVATDIAARGIDISDLTHVINYSLPEDPAVYLHRVGRTGRIGKQGVAISLVSGREMVTLTALEKRFGIKFEERKLPTPEEARRRWTDRHLLELREASRSSVFEAMIPLAQDIKALPEGDKFFAFLLRYFFTHHRIDRAAEQTTGPAPEPRAPRSAERTERVREKPERSREKPERRERLERPAKAPAPETTASQAPAPKAAAPEAAAPDARGARLWCNLGSTDHLDAAGLCDLVVGLACVDRTALREADLRQTFSYLYVDPAVAERFEKTSGHEREGKVLRIEASRARRSRPRR